MLLGIYGDSRAGKDSVARILVYKYQFEWRSFAAPLRSILLAVNPFLEDMSMYLKDAVEDYGWDFVKKNEKHSVEMMISLGQSARDLLAEDIWVRPVFTEPLPKRMVISDVRQPNEYEAITAAGGEVWRVVRPGTTRRGMDGLLDDCNFPVTIYNNGSADDLRNIVEREVNDALQYRWS